VLPGVAARPPDHNSNSILVGKVEKGIGRQFAFKPHRVDTELQSNKL
jgi:hypothetical protein